MKLRTERRGEQTRHDLVRVIQLQVRTGQYRVEPEQVAEHLLAWSRHH
ncbi:MAG: hypothetical protein ACOYN3_03890 [Acidimicrobiia bacterium]